MVDDLMNFCLNLLKSCFTCYFYFLKYL